MAATKRKAKKPKPVVSLKAVEPPAGPAGPGCPVVGIGASAGGLAAFEAFFSGMPAEDTGMSFVLVQHLAPDHKSILAELIRRYTRMKVFEVTNGIEIKPNCAYIIPPNRNMALENGKLLLLEPDVTNGQRLAIDFFFRSLALDQHERAMCVVLAGTGSDGTLGARAVRGEGGLVVAQDPGSTDFNSMPRSVIGAGLADYVLPPAEMPGQLVAFAANSQEKPPYAAVLPDTDGGESFKKVFGLLRTQTGHDFSQYKLNTITRCVKRRMAVHQIGQLDEYFRYLEQSPADVDALFRDVLIGVTSFFRDPAAFDVLQEQVVPRLCAAKSPGSIVRVWVPGCSTGEEAYSLAILLQEQLDAQKLNFKLQIFATDIDRQSIDRARAGVYPASVAIDISPERLERFFVQESDGSAYRVCRSIRDSVIFSEQDVIKDPPFSKIDLISCRNLLIYLGAQLQARLIPLFHYALNPGGMLFLGSSETVGDFGDIFAPVDRKWRLYLRKDAPRARPLEFSLQSGERSAARPFVKLPVADKPSVREVAERTLLQQYTPAGALVSERGDVLYFHGRTGQYLEPAPGEVGMNILKMAREGLRATLTATLHKAALDKETVHQTGVRVKTNGNFTTMNLTVQPVPVRPDAGVESRVFLVVFETVPAVDPESANASVSHPGKGNRKSGTDADKRIAELTSELRAKEEYVQIANADLQSSNEALRSSNEEMQSLNEELQSTIEELETSKEELQSVNEELATLNAELQTKVADLSRSNNDMNNLLAGTGIGTLFVDQQLRIRQFTPAVTQAINLIPTDVGRPVGHIVSNLVGYDSLVADLKAVLNTLAASEVEVQTQAGDWYLLRLRPYRTLEGAIDGAVITFTDVTEIRKARAERLESDALRQLAAVVHDSNDAITVQDMQGQILGWNPKAQRMYGWSEPEALAMNIRDLIPENRREAELAALQRHSRGEVLEPYRMQRIAKNGRIVEVMLTSSALMNAPGQPYAIATTERAIKMKGANP